MKAEGLHTWELARFQKCGCINEGNVQSGNQRCRRVLWREWSSDSSRGRHRGRNRIVMLWMESDTAQYPVNHRIVAGEPVVSKNHRASGIEQSYKKSCSKVSPVGKVIDNIVT